MKQYSNSSAKISNSMSFDYYKLPTNATSRAVIGAAVKAAVIKIGNSVVALYGHEWPTLGATGRLPTMDHHRGISTHDTLPPN